ncbi:hypothetical protein EAF00_003793 [Botryotinia globosa]|nr:hypothetical protein EAF00_003793 [Botryotinia globosa]
MESNEPGERTPLIATITVGPPRQRYEHDAVRRFFTIAAILCLVVAAFIFLLLFPLLEYVLRV